MSGTVAEAQEKRETAGAVKRSGVINLSASDWGLHISLATSRMGPVEELGQGRREPDGADAWAVPNQYDAYS